MQMKKVLIIILSIACCYAKAQTPSVQKAQAFVTMTMPGMAMKDDNGNIINPLPIADRFIFLECRFNGKPKIDTVLYDGVLLQAEIADKEETTNTIGIQKENGKPATLSRRKGNHTWKIYLRQMDDQPVNGDTVKKIIIKGKLGKTPFRYMLNKETELTTPERY
jgi:hypothetical protein